MAKFGGQAPQAKTLGINSDRTGSGIKDRTTAKFKLYVRKFKSFEDFRVGGKRGPPKIQQILSTKKVHRRFLRCICLGTGGFRIC